MLFQTKLIEQIDFIWIKLNLVKKEADAGNLFLLHKLNRCEDKAFPPVWSNWGQTPVTKTHDLSYHFHAM